MEQNSNDNVRNDQIFSTYGIIFKYDILSQHDVILQDLIIYEELAGMLEMGNVAYLLNRVTLTKALTFERKSLKGSHTDKR